MEYEIQFESRRDYLYVTVSGDNTVESVLRYSKDIRDECLRSEQTRVLVVVKLDGKNLSMLEVYKAVAQGSEEAKNVGMRVAYVDPNPEHPVDTMILAEEVAGARGIPVRTFRAVQEAAAWLVDKDHHD